MQEQKLEADASKNAFVLKEFIINIMSNLSIICF